MNKNTLVVFDIALLGSFSLLFLFRDVVVVSPLVQSIALLSVGLAGTTVAFWYDQFSKFSKFELATWILVSLLGLIKVINNTVYDIPYISPEVSLVIVVGFGVLVAINLFERRSENSESEYSGLDSE